MTITPVKNMFKDLAEIHRKKKIGGILTETEEFYYNTMVSQLTALGEATDFNFDADDVLKLVDSGEIDQIDF